MFMIISNEVKKKIIFEKSHIYWIHIVCKEIKVKVRNFSFLSFFQTISSFSDFGSQKNRNLCISTD